MIKGTTLNVDWIHENLGVCAELSCLFNKQMLQIFMLAHQSNKDFYTKRLRLHLRLLTGSHTRTLKATECVCVCVVT